MWTFRTHFSVVICLALLTVIFEKGHSRYVAFDSPKLVSDGATFDDKIDRSSPNILVLKGIDGLENEEEYCRHMYGFLPCTNNLAGHLFLVVVYEYLLFIAEKYVSKGSEMIFQLLGPGFFGACAFHVLGALPEALIVLVSGLRTEESAQEQVFTGVGLLVGSSVLLLTLVWGACVIVGNQEFSELSIKNPKHLRLTTLKTSRSRKSRSCLTGSGVVTDKETSYTARIMVLSLVPFLVLQLPAVLHLQSGRRIAILISLAISIVLLLAYFLYQLFWPWIQHRRLEYVKHENLMIGFLKHVQRHASSKLLTSEGVPNTPAIKRLFHKYDVDADNAIIPSELKSLIMEIKFGRAYSDKNVMIEEVMKDFDIDHDNKISRDEFVRGFVKWLEIKKQNVGNTASSSESSPLQGDLFQEKMKEYARNKYLILKILKHVQSESLRSLVTDDGKPNIAAIETLFTKFDLDGDNYISLPELSNLIQQIEFGNADVKVEDVATHVMEEMDTDGDQKIDKREFLEAVRNLLDPNDHQDTKTDLYLEAWSEADKVVDETTSQKATCCISWNWFKSIAMVLLGTVILTLLADPLIRAVQDLSKAANIHSFFVSFVAVPLATRSRVAMSAISSANRKKTRTTSLTFSELYGFVFMNNVLGLFVLLLLVYVRGLTWNFSAEVLVVLIICVVMGIFASLRSKFPVWTCFIAFLLYPFSLLLVYILNYVFGWS
ncbi:hypothetical protein Sjap_025859 [Stephania japonica]|uniref:EF-hand domain-containing protein n=1 Tax=Stephania japonica TaxID=461633 RepID=A0AAP0EAA3_9MAGN